MPDNQPIIVIDGGAVIKTFNIGKLKVIDMDNLYQGFCPGCWEELPECREDHYCPTCGIDWKEWEDKMPEGPLENCGHYVEEDFNV